MSVVIFTRPSIVKKTPYARPTSQPLMLPPAVPIRPRYRKPRFLSDEKYPILTCDETTENWWPEPTAKPTPPLPNLRVNIPVTALWTEWTPTMELFVN